MANKENLIPMNKRTKSEARELARKGGKRSGEVRQQKKRMREAAGMLASLPLVGKNREQLIALGIPEEDCNQQMVQLVALHKRATTGDPVAIKLFAEIMGEPPQSATALEHSGQITTGPDLSKWSDEELRKICQNLPDNKLNQ